MKPSWHGKHVRPVWRLRRFCSGPVPQIDRATNPWWTNAAFVQYGDWSEGTPKELIDRCRELMAQMAVELLHPRKKRSLFPRLTFRPHNLPSRHDLTAEGQTRFHRHRCFRCGFLPELCRSGDAVFPGMR